MEEKLILKKTYSNWNKNTSKIILRALVLQSEWNLNIIPKIKEDQM